MHRHKPRNEQPVVAVQRCRWQTGTHRPSEFHGIQTATQLIKATRCPAELSARAISSGRSRQPAPARLDGCRNPSMRGRFRAGPPDGTPLPAAAGACFRTRRSCAVTTPGWKRGASDPGLLPISSRRPMRSSASRRIGQLSGSW